MGILKGYKAHISLRHGTMCCKRFVWDATTQRATPGFETLLKKEKSHKSLSRRMMKKDSPYISLCLPKTRGHHFEILHNSQQKSTDFTPPLAVKKIPLLSPGNPGLLYVADTAGDWAASWKFMKWGNCLQFLCWFFHVSRLAMQLEPALQCYKKNVAILDYYLKTFHDVRASSWS